MKNTPRKHGDHKDLLKAVLGISDIAQGINESIKEEENFQKLWRIQRAFGGAMKLVADGRQFIREGPVKKVCRKTDKPRFLLLFSV